MATPVGRSIVSPLLVGRAPELEALAHLIEAALGGRGQTVVIGGEAGIGKTRLVAEAKAYAITQGFRVVQGLCFESDSVCPYAPFLDLLRTHLTDPAEFGPEAGALSPLVPDLVAPPAGGAARPPLDPEQERRLLFAALLRVLLWLAARQPLLVVVEDLHWSDETSLDFLLHLARRIAAEPTSALLVLTYRSDEGSPSLDHFLAELDRGRLATELRLARLDAAGVDAMLRAILGSAHPPSRDLIHTLYELTEGNPFFVEEVLGVLIAAGVVSPDGVRAWSTHDVRNFPLPRSIQDAVRRRAARLGAEARRLLALAAVAGRHFDFALLQALTDWEESTLLELIKELIAAQLVVEVSAEQFAFRHALTRQTVYAELLARERQELHRRVAATLERLQADIGETRLEDLAYHFSEAGDWAKALEYARRAGARALALFAPRAAVEHLTRAIEAVQRLAIAPNAELYRGRGLAHETLGDFERARADLEAALDLAIAADDRRAEWQTLLDLGLLWASRDYARTGEYCRRALDLARTLDDPATLAHSLNRLGNWHLNRDEPLTGRPYHDEALAIFRARHDQRGIAETLDLLGIAHQMSGDLSACAAAYHQAIVLFREMDDRRGLASSMAVLAARGLGYVLDVAYAPPEPLAAAVGEAAQALKLAREIGWRAGETYALIVLGMDLAAQGDYGQALRVVDESLALATEIEHREWLVFAHQSLGALASDLLSQTSARRHHESALALAQAIGSPYWVRGAAGFLALSCVADRDLAAAAAALDAALAPGPPLQSLGQRICWLARAELAFARGDPAQSLAIVDRLIETASNGSTERVVPRLWQVRAEAFAALGRPVEAETQLLAARATAAAQGRHPLLWRLHAALGRLYASQARREDAQHELTAARTIVEALTSTIPDKALHDGFRSSALASLGQPPVPSTREAAKAVFGGLTARERDVAALIARGLTNRAIAADLFVSERTVEGHVANILAKLGFATRSQVAAWAVERGLARPE